MTVIVVSPSGFVSVPSRKTLAFDLMSIVPRSWPANLIPTGLSARTDNVIVIVAVVKNS